MIACVIAGGMAGMVPSSLSSHSLTMSTFLSSCRLTSASASAGVATASFTPASPPYPPSSISPWPAV
jgi:hypothetical protein